MTAIDPHRDSGIDSPEQVVAEVREGEYGDRVVRVEPGGAEFIPLRDRHGSPVHLLWTWMSPNLEFATIFLGVLAVAAFGLTFWQAVLAIIVGTGLGALSHAVLSARGPDFGVPQMILSRVSFGFLGNLLPAGLNVITAGVGWFAVNSVSGALALTALTDLPAVLSLLIVVLVQVVIGVFGHNLISVWERYVLPLLAVVFLIVAVTILTSAAPSAAPGGGGIGGFLLTVGTCFGYTAGWNPYATDYTRYLKPGSGRSAGIFAGLGVFVAVAGLGIVGAASVTISGGGLDGNPTVAFTDTLPSALVGVTLLCIVVGGISANVINIYSGTMSFLAMGIRLPLTLRRAIVALVFGVLGGLFAYFGLADAGQKYVSFLLIISYWVAPWLGVYLADMVLRRGIRVDGFLFDRRHNPIAGWVAMGIGMVVSVLLFSNQSLYVGLVAEQVPSVGDITFIVGFVLSALIYAVLFTVAGDKRSAIMVLPDEAGQVAGR